jgi:antitoxin MazE
MGTQRLGPRPRLDHASAAPGVDQLVDVREEGGRIVIEPVRTPAYELDELLDRMTPETFPGEVDFGPPVGGEVW